jgi:diaminopimelate decarboxylase
MVSVSPVPTAGTYPHCFGLTEAAVSPNQNLFPLTARVSPTGQLSIGGCDVTELVNRFGSPLYILDETTLRESCRHYRQSLERFYPGPSLPIYASKAWNCLAVCTVVASEGLGLDVVSGGELYTALQAGVNPRLIYFHGNNKSREELALALEVGCAVVVDNWYELQLLSELLEASQGFARILIRLTPGIECHTHEYIRTGHLDSKFGFDPDQLPTLFRQLATNPQLQCVGLHAHIGSQIFELEPHQDLAAVLVNTFLDAKAVGLPVEELNVGGGLGIRYTEQDDPPSIEAWVQTVSQAVLTACRERGMETLPKLICEPGRSLIGSACVTAYRVGGRKDIPGLRSYISVDGGMSDNPRPITYQSVYRAVVANRMTAPASETVTIAGKHCESGDVLIKDAPLAATQAGDILVVLATGAYNYSMASNYNRLARPAAVLVNHGEASLILLRETYADLLRNDRLPERLRA